MTRVRVITYYRKKVFHFESDFNVFLRKQVIKKIIPRFRSKMVMRHNQANFIVVAMM